MIKNKTPSKQAKRPVPSAGKRRPGEHAILVQTFLAGVGSVIVSVPLLTPVLLAMPLFPVLFGKQAPKLTFPTMWRWGLTVVISIAVCYAFVSDRVLDSVINAPATVENLRAWVGTAAGDPPASLAYLAVSLVVFVGASALSLGVGGLLVLSTLLSGAAVSAAFLYAAGNNIVQITLIAVSPWLLALLAAMLLWWVPLSAFSRRLLLERTARGFGWADHARGLGIGAGLVVLSLLLRLLLVDVYAGLVQRWTVL